MSALAILFFHRFSLHLQRIFISREYLSLFGKWVASEYSLMKTFLKELMPNLPQEKITKKINNGS
jgi:hypothetical protein